MSKRRCASAVDDMKKIRNLFKMQERPLNAYLITSYDQHNNDKNISICDRRLEYITNFVGGSGNAIISDEDALLWVDGRSYNKSANDLAEPFQLMITGNPGVPSESEWLISTFPYGGAVGACGKYMPANLWFTLAAKLELYDIHLLDVQDDLIEMVWLDRPSLPPPRVFPYPLTYSGTLAHLKVRNVRYEMSKRSIDLLVVTELDEIAWVLNLRGRDMKYSPVFYAFLIIGITHLYIFIDDLTEEVTRHLFAEGIRLCEYEYYQFYQCLLEMASCTAVRRVWISDRANYHVYTAIPKRKVLIQTSPIAIDKCIKNDEEAHGMIEANVYEGYAVCKFFCWLNKAVKKKPAPTELSAAEMLEKLKSLNSDYLGPSCPIVSATGHNTSIVRYYALPSTDLVISANELYLCNTGSQYISGTSYVSRTYCFGKATDFQKECYTRVVKGLINLSTTVFPMNTKGSLLDALPRQALWKAGHDYNHGTGHGVGAYLSFVEGPIGINRRRTDDIGLVPNMFVTNEPAYYKENSFGVRLGNVEHIMQSRISKSEDVFLTFENITLVPYQVTMLVPSLLTAREIDYVNSYHLKIRSILAPVYKSENSMDEYNWIMKMTEPMVH